MRVLNSVFAILFLFFVVLTSCQEKKNLDSTNDLTSFRLAVHDSIKGLNGYVFTVNLPENRIYLKDDSLPYKSDRFFKKLKPMMTPSTFSSVTFNGVQWHTNDSVDFSSVQKGIPVKMMVISQDGKNTKEYSIQFMAHTVDPEKIHWSLVNQAVGQDRPASGYDTRSFRLSNGNYCQFLKTNSEVQFLSTGKADSDWNTQKVEGFPYTASVRYIQTAGLISTSFYVADQGLLYRSDNGVLWNRITPNKPIAKLICSLNGLLIGQTETGFVSSYDGLSWSEEVPFLGFNMNAFPQDGFAAFEMNTVTHVPKVLLIGGADQNQTNLSSVWSAFNSLHWVYINEHSLNNYPARRDAVAFSYGGKFFIAGGQSTDPQFDEERLYTSPDEGLNWFKADTNVYLPPYFNGLFEGVDAVEDPTDKCIYLLGIKDKSSGKSQVWKGIVNKYLFKQVE